MTNINNYEKAYAEVIEVLNYIPMNEYEKIPKKYIVFMEENCSENTPFTYNIALPFNQQNISDTAKNILGMIFRLFIIGQSKKEELNNKEQKRKKQEELENYIKYNPDNLFKNKKDSSETIEKTVIEKKDLLEYNESFFKKIWNKILSIFKKH